MSEDYSKSYPKSYPSPFGPGRSTSIATSGMLNMGLNPTSGSISSPYGSFSDERRFTSSGSALLHASVTEKYSLAADPTTWGYSLSPDTIEPDDWLHDYDPRREDRGAIFSTRALGNLGCLLALGLALLALFAGYPIATYFEQHTSRNSGLNLGSTNASGQVPDLGNWGLIDQDTPESAYTINSYTDGSTKMQLVFSDEFNQDGRSFYPGDDPYWEAVDLHYWQTNNLEWYDPSAITTKNGSLVITLSKVDDPSTNHDLQYRGRMMTTWNKFCFTSGMMLTSVVLPGANNVMGLWPAIWTMGNLGRAGYGASLDGMWPYSYDACDVGTLQNQTLEQQPRAALTTGPNDGTLSYLPGQRLSRCTCSGEDLDSKRLAGITDDAGYVSQSAQWGPFNAYYEWFNTSDSFVIYDETVTELNSYTGGVFQQATSGISKTGMLSVRWGCFSTYGFEYKPGYNDAFISWINDDTLAWTIKASGMAADDRVEISARPIPQEPMYMIINLGISENFGFVDVEHLQFPASMSVDWIRVYQNEDSINIGCDPPDFPTAAYIEQYLETYNNPNYTTFVGDFGQTNPKNSLIDTC
ncbi:hypothetical protein D9758_002859 [Tetrapyrgos nigripes]|uniref:GH16 domain-containing protein n=1 Tax=Tetrapyrgos nigripes TaxID=182062 RepID=A0A8H5LTI5_9AGAR|nr:hypothetical protein D9758_002859 [Tetrapyrgos nigripes]